MREMEELKKELKRLKLTNITLETKLKNIIKNRNNVNDNDNIYHTHDHDPKRYVYIEKKHLCLFCGYRTISNWKLNRHLKSCYKKYFFKNI